MEFQSTSNCTPVDRLKSVESVRLAGEAIVAVGRPSVSVIVVVVAVGPSGDKPELAFSAHEHRHWSRFWRLR